MIKLVNLFLFALILSVLVPIAHAAQTSSATNTRDAYAPFEEILQITPSDVTTYDPPLRGCIVEVAGDLELSTVKSGSDVTITVIVGQLVPAMIDQVKSGTTATVVCGR